MVTIRLARIGKRKHPTYRLVVSDKRKDTTGPFLEHLGTHDPHTSDPSGTKLKVERVQYWLSVGATVSPTVHNLLVAAKLIDAKPIPRGRAKKKEGAAAPLEAKAAGEGLKAEPSTSAKDEAAKPEPAPSEAR